MWLSYYQYEMYQVWFSLHNVIMKSNLFPLRYMNVWTGVKWSCLGQLVPFAARTSMLAVSPQQREPVLPWNSRRMNAYVSQEVFFVGGGLTYWRQRSWSTSGTDNGLVPNDSKPSPETMLISNQVDAYLRTYYSEISIKTTLRFI